ncbi:uncharacterized protein LOC131017903 [Salvia miltiorrhiza]|uniref:uncharacterized protein LOC131017903 n=1 Tax=Salvia miltiorrhiza TaxID=226208 RepID=UPI0025AD60D0|nr:uncharacterized protein LOC131017903 [Salvia miltiorrhiza]
MYRQYSSRNQRNRGIKVKNALQICLFVAICFWLIYQVKRSHDKNEEFEASGEKGFLDRGSVGGLIRIRRKNIHPLYEEIVTEKKQDDEATEEEETTEEDEHEVDKLNTEVDQEEDNVTDGAREDGIDRETEGEISDDGNGREPEISVEDGSHDRGDKSNHEAREDFHEADGASSSVTHDNHTWTAENEKEVRGITDQQHPENILEQENKENRSEEANDSEIQKRLEMDGGENNSDYSEKGLSLTEAPIDTNVEPSNTTTDVSAENPKLPEQNFTESVAKLDHDQGISTEGTSTEGSNLKTIGLQQANTSTLTVENYLLDSKSTGHTEPKTSESNGFSKPSNDTDSSAFARMTRSDHSLEDGTNTQKNKTVSDISVSINS